jgi:hypothetical protein
VIERRYRALLATQAAARPAYARMDQIQMGGIRVREPFLQAFWDSINLFDRVLDEARTVLVMENLPEADPEDVDPCTATSALLGRSALSVVNIYSKSSVSHFLPHLRLWLLKRRLVLKEMEEAVLPVSIDAVAAVSDALQPVQAMLDMFDSNDERDHPVRFYDKKSNKLGKWTR